MSSPNQTVENVISAIATGLSLSATLVMLYFCLRTPGAKPTTLKMIILMTISDFFYSISNALSLLQNQNSSSIDMLCYVQGMLRASCFILSLWFAGSLSILCYKTCTSETNFDQERFLKRSIISGTTVSAILVIL